LTSGDSQRKDKENHLDAMLEKHEEEFSLLKESKSEREITTREGRCSHVLGGEDMFIEIDDAKVNCNLQFSNEYAYIERDDEHETCYNPIIHRIICLTGNFSLWVYRLANNISSLQIIFKEEKIKFMVVYAERFFLTPWRQKQGKQCTKST
jgi:hypothetical protein